MQKPSLQKQKKELDQLSLFEVKQLCIRLSKHKTENKELLHYLLFYAHDIDAYILEIKAEMLEVFEELPTADYYRTKNLRKLVIKLNKYIKFIGIKKYEAEISIEFCRLFIEYAPLNTYHKALINILSRQIVKLNKCILKLEDDLKYDFEQDLIPIIHAIKKCRNSNLFILPEL